MIDTYRFLTTKNTEDGLMLEQITVGQLMEYLSQFKSEALVFRAGKGVMIHKVKVLPDAISFLGDPGDDEDFQVIMEPKQADGILLE